MAGNTDVQVSAFPNIQPAAYQAGTGAEAALYVDSAGNGHVAYLDGTGGIVLCTIAPGASSCANPTTLHLNSPSGDGATSLKYLADSQDNSFLLAADAGGSGTYVFTSFFTGQFAGSALGPVYDGGGGMSGLDGDALLEPSGSGIDQVGWAGPNPLNSQSQYAFDPLVKGAPTSAPQPLAPAGSDLVDLTKLPNGQTALFAAPRAPVAFPGHTFGRYPISMSIQTSAQGPFGPWQQLGLDGPISPASAASGGSYLLSGSANGTANVKVGGVPDSVHLAPLQLYPFRGTLLTHPLTVGQSTDVAPGTGWHNLPPVFEDGAGRSHLAWRTFGSFDGCPPGGNHSPASNTCVMYRALEPGQVLGPKIVLRQQPANFGSSNNGRPVTTPFVWALESIAANTQGAGWVLMLIGQHPTPGSLSLSLVADPIPASATVSGAPSVHGNGVQVGLSCSGGAGAGCPVSAQLSSGGAHGARAAAHHSRTLRLGSASATIADGQHKTLLVKLNRAAKRLLAGHRRPLATLTVTERVGAVAVVVTQQRVRL